MNKTIAMALCAASFLLPVSGVRSQTPIGDLQRHHGVTISGTVKSVVGNEFILRDSSGEIIVDAGPRWWQEVNLTPGERVTVVGEYDDDDFDAYSISRSSGEVIQIRTGPGRPPWAGGPDRANARGNRRGDRGIMTISGTVKSVVGNEFIINDGSKEIIVDAGPRWWREVNLTPGERVTVVGEYDDDDFDAYSISRSSGEVIKIRTEDDDDPWEER